MPRLFPCKCIVCGDKFHSERNPALYCSNAHRQAAYRQGMYTPATAPVKKARNSLALRRSAARQLAQAKRNANKARRSKRRTVAV